MSEGTIKERLVGSVLGGAGGYFGALGLDWILEVTFGIDLSGEVFGGVLQSIFGSTLAEFLLPLMGIPVGLASYRETHKRIRSFVRGVWMVVVWVPSLALFVTPVALLVIILLGLPAETRQVVVVIASAVFGLLLVLGLLVTVCLATAWSRFSEEHGDIEDWDWPLGP